MKYLSKILNFINNKEVSSKSGKFFLKINPANGKTLGKVSRSNKVDVLTAVESAQKPYEAWSETSIIDRSVLLRDASVLIEKRKKEIAELVHSETGKSLKDASGEVSGAIELGFFMAG